jgi:dynein intermediate chain
MSTSTSDIEPDSDEDRGRRKRTDGGSGRETEDEMRKRILDELDEERKVLERELRELKAKVEIKALPGELDAPPQFFQLTADLSNERKQAIFAAPDFSAFVEESSKIVQRALSDGYDYIRDYTVGIDGAL